MTKEQYDTIKEFGLSGIYTDAPEYATRVELLREAISALEPPQAVKIMADDDSVAILIGSSTPLNYDYPGTLTGADLEGILGALGVEVEYTYDEGE